MRRAGSDRFLKLVLPLLFCRTQLLRSTHSQTHTRCSTPLKVLVRAIVSAQRVKPLTRTRSFRCAPVPDPTDSTAGRTPSPLHVPLNTPTHSLFSSQLFCIVSVPPPVRVRAHLDTKKGMKKLDMPRFGKKQLPQGSRVPPSNLSARSRACSLMKNDGSRHHIAFG